MIDSGIGCGSGTDTSRAGINTLSGISLLYEQGGSKEERVCVKNEFLSSINERVEKWTAAHTQKKHLIVPREYREKRYRERENKRERGK